MTLPPTTFRLDPDIRAGMDTLKDRDGIPLNEQANRAIRVYLQQKGILKKPTKSQ